VIKTTKSLLVTALTAAPLLFTACSPDDVTDSFKYTAHYATAFTILSIDSNATAASSIYGQNQRLSDDDYYSTATGAGDHLILRDRTTDPRLTIELSADRTQLTTFSYTDSAGVTYSNFDGDYSGCQETSTSADWLDETQYSSYADYRITYYNCPVGEGSLYDANNNAINIADGNISVAEIYYEFDLLEGL